MVREWYQKFRTQGTDNQVFLEREQRGQEWRKSWLENRRKGGNMNICYTCLYCDKRVNEGKDYSKCQASPKGVDPVTGEKINDYYYCSTINANGNCSLYEGIGNNAEPILNLNEDDSRFEEAISETRER